MPSTYGASKFERVDGAVAVQGFAGLQRALRRIADGTQPLLRAKLRTIGDQVALVAAANAPRLTGELQHSIRTSVTVAGASVYSNSLHGGALNVGAWTKHGRGPHISRARASHYMDRAVDELTPWVQTETEAVIDWAMTTFETP